MLRMRDGLAGNCWTKKMRIPKHNFQNRLGTPNKNLHKRIGIHKKTPTEDTVQQYAGPRRTWVRSVYWLGWKNARPSLTIQYCHVELHTVMVHVMHIQMDCISSSARGESPKCMCEIHMLDSLSFLHSHLCNDTRSWYTNPFNMNQILSHHTWRCECTGYDIIAIYEHTYMYGSRKHVNFYGVAIVARGSIIAT